MNFHIHVAKIEGKQTIQFAKNSPSSDVFADENHSLKFQTRKIPSWFRNRKEFHDLRNRRPFSLEIQHQGLTKFSNKLECAGIIKKPGYTTINKFSLATTFIFKNHQREFKNFRVF